MIVRSYRNLLVALSRGFSKDDKRLFKDRRANPNQQNRQPESQKQPKKASQQQSPKKPAKQRPPKIKPPIRSPADNKADPLSKKAQESNEKFAWEGILVNLNKAQGEVQIEKVRAFVQGELGKNREDFETGLRKDLGEIDKIALPGNVANNVYAYLEKDFANASQFVSSAVLPVQSSSEQGQKAINGIVSRTIRQFIKHENLEGLTNFLQKVPKEARIDALSNIELVAQLEESPTKYLALSHLIKQVEEKLKQDDKKKLQIFVRSAIQKFLIQIDKSTPKKVQSLKQSFSSLLKSVIDRKFLPQRYVRSRSFYRLLSALYLGQSSRHDKYEELFELLKAVKVSVVTIDDALEEFYQAFLLALEDKQLESTDCEETALPVNANLLKHFDALLKDKDRSKASIVTVVAVSLHNRYLSIPQHFLQATTKSLRNEFPNTLIAAIKQQYKLLQLSEYMKQPQKNKKQLKSLLIELAESARVLTKLRLAILTKDYEGAMKIYNEEYFKRACVERQKNVLTYVLKKFAEQEIKKMEPESNQRGGQRGGQRVVKDFSYPIDRFISRLGVDYLWDSWKKSEDIGYLMEDYYVKDGEQGEGVKAEKRFSFWESYFETKRAREISRFEKLGELSSIREPEQEPLLESQFSLNKYLSAEHRDRYRALADHTDRRDTELEQYFNRVQLILLSLSNADEDETTRSKILEYQRDLTEQSLKLLQDFGIKDYDIEVHDVEQLKNRIAEFKKYRGVIRLSNIYNRKYPSQDEFDYFAEQDEFYPKFKKIMTGELAVHQNVDEELLNQMALEQEASGKIIPNMEGLETVAQGEQPAEGEAAVPAEGEAPVEAAESQPEPKKTKKTKPAVEEPQAEGEVKVEAETVEAVEAAEVAEESQPEEQVVAQQAVKASQQRSKIHISEKNPSDIWAEETRNFQNITKQFVDLLRIKRKDLFIQASLNTKLSPSPHVNQLIRWGVLHRQPMSIYMGEKLAMQTGQLIPHSLAIRVSDMLNYHREIDQSLNRECKICLSHIGRIERQFIYSNDYHYHHIYEKPVFSSSVDRFNQGVKDRLEDLVSVPFSKLEANKQPREIYRKVGKGPIL